MRLPKHFLLLNPTVEAIGNCAEELYFGLLRARREGKWAVFFFPEDVGKIVFSKGGFGINHALTSLRSPYRCNLPSGVTKLATIFLTLFFGLFIVLNYIPLKLFSRSSRFFPVMPSHGRSSLWSPCFQKTNSFVTEPVDWARELNTPIPIISDQPIFEKSSEVAARLGLPKSEPFICLHVREGGYYRWTEGPGKVVRNANIANYFESIANLAQRGYWVIRIGDKTMTPLPKMPQVIDYALSDLKTPELDIYLIAHCEFYIGHNSGPWDVANLFGKPVMMPNMTDFFLGYPFKSNDMGIFKKIYSQTNSRPLTLEEMINVYLDPINSIFSNSDLRFIENNSEEILELLDEFLLSQSNPSNGGLPPPYCPNTELLTRRRKDAARAIASLMSLNPIERDRTLSRLHGCTGKISRRFLERMA
jgi:putative glycosyltransferase (TIGR04372 family)